MREDELYLKHRAEWLGAIAHFVTKPVAGFSNLTYLRCRRSDIGNQGRREIVASGILRRLKFLDLAGGCITDAGAQLLAECPEARNLEWLDLSFNDVTDAGLQLLREASIPVESHRRAPGDNRYIYMGE